MRHIIYACYSGTHAAVVAAAIHLGWLESQVIPSWEQLEKLPGFNVSPGRGGLRFLGHTREGYNVYSAAVGNDGEVVRRTLQTFLPLVGHKPGKVLWFDVSQKISVLWRLGAFLQKYPGLYHPGTVLLRWSLSRDYQLLVSLVTKALKQVRLEKQNII